MDTLSFVENLIGTAITSFTGAYQADGFSIIGDPAGVPARGEDSPAGNVVDGPNADLLYVKATGEVLLDFNDIAGAAAQGDDEWLPRILDSAPHQIVLANEDGLLFTENFREAPVIAEPFSSPYRLGWGYAYGMPEDYRFDMGAVLSADIGSADELSEFLDLAHYAGYGATGEFDLIVIADDGEISEAANAMNGDANRDGIVNSLDLNIVALNWRQEANGWSDGDFDGNGRVDVQDLNDLATNWRQREPVTAVPEPHTAFLTTLVICAMLGPRVRRRWKNAVR